MVTKFDPEAYWEDTLVELAAASDPDLWRAARQLADAHETRVTARESGVREPAPAEEMLRLRALVEVLAEREPLIASAFKGWKEGVGDKPSGPLIGVLLESMPPEPEPDAERR